MDLCKKTALVTGGGRGIGRAAALALAGAGADVTVTYAHDEAAAEEVALEIAEQGGNARVERFQATEDGSEAQLVANVVRHSGRIDVLVNNAGMLTRIPFLEVSGADFDAVHRVNLRSPYLLTQEVARVMIAQGTGGSVINVSSISAHSPAHGLSHYECAKAGLSMLTKGAALDLGPHKIRVNAIEPGLIATDINREQWENHPELWRQRCAPIPLGRAGEPHDCAPLVLLLASDAGAWITGSCFVVDGGLTLVGGPGNMRGRAVEVR